MPPRKTKASGMWLPLAVAVVAAISAITVAWIQFRPPRQQKVFQPELAAQYFVAGRVIDPLLNAPVGHASISLAGRTESYVTEDNGNFRLAVKKDAIELGGVVRVHVSKDGYVAVDMTVSPPVENVIILMRRAQR